MVVSSSPSVLRKSFLLLVALGCFAASIPGLVEARATMSDTPVTLSFIGIEGGTNPQKQTFTIFNTGNRKLRWSITDSANWLTVLPTSGTTTTEGDKIVVSVNIVGLVANTYTATITISSPQVSSTSRQIVVTLIVSPPVPRIAAYPTSLTFVGSAGGANPAAQSINISNTGMSTLRWNVTDDASWLNVNPVSGTTTTETDSIMVSVNAASLTANTYTATVTLIDPSSNNVQQVPVTLILTAPDSSSAVLNWDRNPEANVAGYKLYVGTGSRSYGSSLDLGNVTTFKVIGLSKGKTYFFAITAYDTAGNESTFSNEGSKTIN